MLLWVVMLVSFFVFNLLLCLVNFVIISIKNGKIYYNNGILDGVFLLVIILVKIGLLFN